MRWSEYRKWLHENRTWLSSGATLLLLLTVPLYISSRRGANQLELIQSAPVTARSQEMEIGGIRRPQSDIRSQLASAQQADTQNTPTPVKYPYGTTPKLSADANPSVAVAMTALRSKEAAMPELLSPMIQPAAFDQQVYSANKQQYLAASVPGRVWQTSQPGDNVPVLGAVGRTQMSMRQGESVRLSVRSAPESPVTFTSFDLGAFSNGLASITVEADNQGVAVAEFSAPTGTAYRVNLLAGSPLATGQVQFRIIVDPGNGR